MTSALLAASLSRPPSSCLFWKRAAALLVMRARWRLLKATSGVAAPPESESCPAPEPRALGPGSLWCPTTTTTTNLSALHPLWGNFSLKERRSCPAPHPIFPSCQQGDSSIGAMDGEKMPGLARLGILSGQGHRVKTPGEKFTAGQATLGLCLNLFSPWVQLGF